MFRELERIIKLIGVIDDVKKRDPFFAELVHTETLTTINHHTHSYPIHAFVIGSRDPKAPTLGLFGGVHGLERVGTQVVIGFLKSLIAQLQWDRALGESLKTFRIVSIPLINPVGMKTLRRANGNGVDLMRNSPIEAVPGPFYRLYRGHRISPKLPWYRGKLGAPMETESLALIDFVKREMFASECSMCIDFHSGFGLRDRLWYPYAKTFEPFKFKAQVDRVSELFKKTHPHHIYKIEQQSDSYTTHGDLWDHLFHEFEQQEKGNIFIPWTLEMGSWIWLKKNPTQLFSKEGMFNPVVEHRYQRTMRRHYILIEFFTRLIQNPHAWTNP
jgi:predicted deacylase